MKLETAKFNCRAEELPVIGGFLHGSMGRDLVDITAVYPDMDAAYLGLFKSKVKAVDELVNPVKLTKQLKLLTDSMYKNIDSIRPLMLNLEGYVKRASGLTVGVKDFGIKEVRKCIGNKDAEGLDMKLKVLLENITENMAALTAKGYTATKKTELEDLKANIKADNLKQQELIEERSTNVKNNMGVLNDLWVTMQDVMDAGKRVMKASDLSKVDDYTFTKLKTKVRAETKKKE